MKNKQQYNNAGCSFPGKINCTDHTRNVSNPAWGRQKMR